MRFELLSLATGVIAAAGDQPFQPSELATTIRNFIAPLVLLAISVVALTYLAKKQMTQFLQFVGLAILVGVIFYVPNVVEAIARWVGTLFGGTPV